MNHIYDAQDVLFENKSAGITLAGTLTLPRGKGPFPAVILIAGMGPNDRDYTMFSGHKLFAVLADYLTQHGIAVLRYDKRGVGKSTGTYDMNLTSQDFAQDAHAGVEYLKTRPEINSKKIGLIGHSEGGMIAPMVAAESKDVAFLVLLAAAAATSVQDAIELVALQLHADGASDAFIAHDRTMREQLLTIVKQEPDSELAKKRMHAIIADYLKKLPEAQKTESEKFLFAINAKNAEDTINMFNSPWYRYFFMYDPAVTLKRITIPVLALNGDTDFVAASKIELPIIKQALAAAGNKNYTVIELPKLNHWFQTCKTGALAEYGTIKETISPLALTTTTDWIVAHIADKN